MEGARDVEEGSLKLSARNQAHAVLRNLSWNPFTFMYEDRFEMQGTGHEGAHVHVLMKRLTLLLTGQWLRGASHAIQR